MFKLVILCVFDPRARVPDREEVLRDEFETSSQAELRALRWLMFRPYDIVMLEEVHMSTCKNCGKPIEEKPGWVRHRWIHTEDGTYACRYTGGATQAEPKEEVA